MPNLKPPVTTRRRTPPRYRERILAALPPRQRLQAADDAVPDRCTEPAEIDRAAASGFVVGVKCYPAGATTHSDSGVHFARTLRRRARAHGGARCRAAGARRGDRRRDRSLRPRERLHRARARPARARHPRACASCSSTSPRAPASSSCARAASGSPRRSRPSTCCYNRDAMFRRRPSPAPLLPADPQARARSRGADRGGDQRQSALLPRHRQRAACAAHQGIRLRLRRHVLGAPPRSSCTRRPSRRPGGSTRSRRSRAYGADFYGLPRNRGHDHARAAGRGPCPASLPFGGGRSRADVRGRDGSTGNCGNRAVRGMNAASAAMRDRFRGFLPVVVDVETGGFNAATDALLEIAAVLIEIDAGRTAGPGTHASASTCGPSRAADSIPPRSRSTASIPGIRCASPRPKATRSARFSARCATRCASRSARARCSSATTPSFDLGFLNAAVARAGIKRNPFHPFSCFDTATLAGVAFGQTVLSRAIAGRGTRLEFRGSAFGGLRRRAHRGSLLRRLQPVPAAVPGRGRAARRRDGASRRAAESAAASRTPE